MKVYTYQIRGLYANTLFPFYASPEKALEAAKLTLEKQAKERAAYYNEDRTSRDPEVTYRIQAKENKVEVFFSGIRKDFASESVEIICYDVIE